MKNKLENKLGIKNGYLPKATRKEYNEKIEDRIDGLFAISFGTMFTGIVIGFNDPYFAFLGGTTLTLGIQKIIRRYNNENETEIR